MEKYDANRDTRIDVDGRFLRSNIYSQISLSLRVIREADHLPKPMVDYAYSVIVGFLYGDGTIPNREHDPL